MKKRMLSVILAVTAVCVGIMLVVDGLWQPGYLVKSIIKATLFLLLPLAAAHFMPELNVKALFIPKKQGIFQALGLGILVYGVILGGYFALRGLIDFSGIAGNLAATTGVTRENFLLVSLYISFANSLLEEFFFRGFCFWGLQKCSRPAFAYGFSALAFSLYHTAMMAGWFPWYIFALALVGLAVGGLLFSWLNARQANIYPSWLVHMFANFAINTVGFLLL